MPNAPTPTDLNFSDTNPPAPAGRQNVKWLASSPPYLITVNINGVLTQLPFRDVSASYANAGSPGGAAIQVYKVALAPTVPGPFTVAHHLPAAPAFVLIEMSTGGTIWLQSPTSVDATNLYLVASDPGITGTALCFMSPPDLILPLAPSGPGPFAVAHGLGVAPQYVVVEMNSAGSIWFQTTAADATNIYMTASDAGVTGFAYAWITVPHIAIVSVINVTLNPAAPGNFTVAHSLGAVPSVVVIRMRSTGRIWFQSPTGYDASNLYLVASDGGIVGDAELWT